MAFSWIDEPEPSPEEIKRAKRKYFIARAVVYIQLVALFTTILFMLIAIYSVAFGYNPVPVEATDWMLRMIGKYLR